jgi:hypothetical protein
VHSSQQKQEHARKGKDKTDMEVKKATKRRNVKILYTHALAIPSSQITRCGQGILEEMS